MGKIKRGAFATSDAGPDQDNSCSKILEIIQRHADMYRMKFYRECSGGRVFRVCSLSVEGCRFQEYTFMEDDTTELPVDFVALLIHFASINHFQQLKPLNSCEKESEEGGRGLWRGDERRKWEEGEGGKVRRGEKLGRLRSIWRTERREWGEQGTKRLELASPHGSWRDIIDRLLIGQNLRPAELSVTCSFEFVARRFSLSHIFFILQCLYSHHFESKALSENNQVSEDVLMIEELWLMRNTAVRANSG
ncbi:hypothetical protein Tco_0496763 [Tanacetum coccineum]|uniref:Uncharacterized protein n=1 Tax=Tanacetum coccineum TaxID=301880 RepID=A0ABQ5EAT2_9ASTR